MLHGGARPGAGRPKGSRAERTAKLAIAVATAGIQPIEVVLSVMRNAWEQQDYKTAAEMAEIALPYTTETKRKPSPCGLNPLADNHFVAANKSLQSSV
jgi:hypothetical protein